jgi:kynurenine formamidase
LGFILGGKVVEVFEWGNKRIALIDLSDTLENETRAFEPNAHEIRYIDHVEGMRLGAEVFKMTSDVLEKAFPRGHAWAVELVTVSTHSGTHVDAPYHYGPLMADGRPARTIDQVPLRWCFGDGVVLDMTHKKRGDGISANDIEEALEKIGYTLKPYDIVLIRTDVYKRFKEPGYDLLHPGLTRDGVAFLVERGVKLIGIDAWGLDRPFDVMLKEALEGKYEFWQAHFYGLEQEYCQIEKLTNLDKIPRPYGFTVIAFPFKIKGASAGWARVVALVELEEDGS